MVLGSGHNNSAHATAKEMVNPAGRSSHRPSHIVTGNSCRAGSSSAEVFAPLAFYPLRGQCDMSRAPKVSVVIPCFNHGEFLPEAVASVTGIKPDDVEIIVVDDGSTDERTRAEMDKLTAQGINVIRQENRGLAAARNTGILVSKAEYILPLDADNCLRPAYIEHGIRILD